jgi:hypothetical protein
MIRRRADVGKVPASRRLDRPVGDTRRSTSRILARERLGAGNQVEIGQQETKPPCTTTTTGAGAPPAS